MKNTGGACRFSRRPFDVQIEPELKSERLITSEDSVYNLN